jgi:hypothetical protein
MKHKLAIFGSIALLSLAGLASAAWMALEPTNERTQLLFNEPQGVVTSGSKLGVHIGDPWHKADAAILSQFEPRYVLWQVGESNGMGGGFTFPDGPVLTGEAEVAYRDGGWRNGTIALDLRDGRVVAITWHYSGPFYIDL